LSWTGVGKDTPCPSIIRGNRFSLILKNKNNIILFLYFLKKEKGFGNYKNIYTSWKNYQNIIYENEELQNTFLKQDFLTSREKIIILYFLFSKK